MNKPEFWLIPTLFAFGVIAGTTWLLLSPSDHNPPDTHAGKSTANDPDPERSGGPAMSSAPLALRPPVPLPSSTVLDADEEAAIQAVRKGDHLLQGGNYADAVRLFQRAVRLNGGWTSENALRLAFCAELMGMLPEALAHYERAIDTASTPVHRYLAELGTARVRAARGHPGVALSGLSELFLNLDETTGVPEEIRARVVFQLAHLFGSFALQDYAFDLNRPDGVAFPPEPRDIESTLQLIRGEPIDDASASATPEPIPDGLNLLQRPTDDVDTILVSGQIELTPITILINQLSVIAKLDIQTSPQAQQAIVGRAKRMTLRSVPISLLLDTLLLPLDLCWYQDGAAIQIVSLGEVASTADGRLYWNRAADRVYRRFSIAFPGDSRMDHVLAERAILKLIEGDVDGASKYLYEVRQKRPTGEMMATVFFNLAKLNLRLGRIDEAIETFYNAVDQSQEPRLQASGYWHVAQLYLESGRYERAVHAGGRSMATARNEAQRRLTALTMARAYLMLEDPSSANKILFDSRGAFEDSDLYSIGAILGSYARYLGSADETARTIAARRLLTALSETPDDRYPSFIDLYLAGKAYQVLGFPNRSLDKLRLASRSTDILLWQRRILFELASELIEIDPASPEAEKLFTFLVGEAHDPWARRSRIALAEYYLNQRQPERCLEQCQEVWKGNGDLDLEDQKFVLQIMGQAYADLGQHYTAALCFAGKLPVAEPVSTSESGRTQ